MSALKNKNFVDAGFIKNKYYSQNFELIVNYFNTDPNLNPNKKNRKRKQKRRKREQTELSHTDICTMCTEQLPVSFWINTNMIN